MSEWLRACLAALGMTSMFLGSVALSMGIYLAEPLGVIVGGSAIVVTTYELHLAGFWRHRV